MASSRDETARQQKLWEKTVIFNALTLTFYVCFLKFWLVSSVTYVSLAGYLVKPVVLLFFFLVYRKC